MLGTFPVGGLYFVCLWFLSKLHRELQAFFIQLTCGSGAFSLPAGHSLAFISINLTSWGNHRFVVK